MSSETILVVDDNRQIADFVASKILPNLGFDALIAYNGASARRIVRQHRNIALMLLDLQMPDTTGLDLLRELRGEGFSIPTILITGQGSEQIVAEAFRLGVEDYLSKPIDPDQLNDSIARALSESRLRREKQRLNARLEAQVSWLTALAKVGQSVTSSLDLDEVLRRIVEAGVLLTRAEEGFLALLDEGSDQLYLRAVKNIDEERSKTLRLPVHDSLVGEVMRTGRPYRSTRDPDDEPLKVSTGFLVHSLLHVPLSYKGKKMGVLTVDNHTSNRPFVEADEIKLTSLADYAAVAIENARLYEQAQDEIDERTRVQEALRESEERYMLAVTGANDGLWDWDLKTNRIYFSPRWKSLLGYEPDEIGDDPDEWFERIHPDDVERVKLDISAHIHGVNTHFESEHRIQHKNSAFRWMLTRGCAVTGADGNAYRMAGSQTDITDRKIAEERLLHNAFHDTLTDLPNRALFTDHLRHAIARAQRREDYQFAVLFLDLDRFKDVNDSLGHMIGDKLLVAFARVLAEGLRDTDIVARLGGDEFAILLEDVQEPKATIRVAEWIKEKLANPFHLEENEVYATVSTGIVLSNPEYANPDDMLRDADIAMYYAKANGKDRFEIFDTVMRETIMERLTLEADLRGALERKELLLNYQPIVSLENGQLVGFEALVRWQHPKRGLMYPLEFIPLAESTGMIIDLDRWVLTEACTQMHAWQQIYTTEPPLTISVNFSSKQIAQPDIVAIIEQVLDDTGLDSRSLKIEITENTIMAHNEQTLTQLHAIQDLGVHIQIDDFGIGFSSLSYLSQFPVNALKIDQAFVGKMSEEESSLKIVHSIVSLSHNLALGVIAEGVETDAQLDHLKSLGCEYGQGFLVSTPLPKPDVEYLLEQLLSGTHKFRPWDHSGQEEQEPE